MTSWVLIAVVAYLFYAISGVIDKNLLSRSVKHPAVYAFYSGVLIPLVFVLAPWGFQWLPLSIMFVALFSGICFSVALYFFFTAIQQTSISRILPIEGGFVPLFTFIFARLFLNETLTSNQYFAFIFLVLGAVIISLKTDRTGEYHPKAIKTGIVSAVFFALSFVLAKYIYGQTNFINGLIWTKLGIFLASIFYLIIPKTRQWIIQAPRNVAPESKLLFYTSKFSGTLAGLLENYAISLGTVSIVKAMQGTQYAFLLIVTSLLTVYSPRILKEKISKGILLQKLFAIMLITLGLVLLT